LAAAYPGPLARELEILARGFWRWGLGFTRIGPNGLSAENAQVRIMYSKHYF
jgi:hypothetical protein